MVCLATDSALSSCNEIAHRPTPGHPKICEAGILFAITWQFSDDYSGASSGLPNLCQNHFSKCLPDKASGLLTLQTTNHSVDFITSLPYGPSVPMIGAELFRHLAKRKHIMVRFFPGIIAMALIVVASNVLVQYHFGTWLTWGAFTYPFAFLVTDVTNRIYGPAVARRIVFAGFIVGIICSLIAAGLDKTTLRIAVASGAAFLLAQLLDILIFSALRSSGGWWKAPLVSSFFGSALDTTLFFSIAFSMQLSFIDPADNIAWANELVPLLGFGPGAPVWASLAVADWSVKLLLALIALVPFRLIIRSILNQRIAF